VSFPLQVQSCSDNVHVYDFHVVYSYSYKVPVLYFQGHRSGMHFGNISEHSPPCVVLFDNERLFLYIDCQLLTLDEIKHHLPSNSLKVLSESEWTFITREV